MLILFTVFGNLAHLFKINNILVKSNQKMVLKNTFLEEKINEFCNF